MKVFVTGASGFVGSAIVKELLTHGHQVLGLVRKPEAVEKLKANGAEAIIGDVNDPNVLEQAARDCEAVIHTAFNHDDFSKFKASCEADRKVIETLGTALIGTEKPLVVTSGMALFNFGRLVGEDEPVTVTSDVMPRAASEEATNSMMDKGVKAYIMRLPPSVHAKGDRGFVPMLIAMAKGDRGFVPMLIAMAKEKGEAAYLGEGLNHWPAVHRDDAAKVYRMIVEQQPEQRIFHAVAEQGILFKEIAKTIAEGLQLQLSEKNGMEVEAYFGWFTHFASLNVLASSVQTQTILKWSPKEIGLLEDVRKNYFDTE